MRASGDAVFKDTGIAVSQMASMAESPQGEVWLADRVRGSSPRANAQGLMAEHEREARRLPDLVAARLQFTADGALWATMSPHGGVARVTFQGDHAVRMERFDSPHGLTATSAVPIIVDREGNLWLAYAHRRPQRPLPLTSAGQRWTRVWLWRGPQTVRSAPAVA
ncbi:hypothetical protein G6F32_015400 [Rhizopus arrhizus]|nr:hypothetical protein G6F32_015400 [Rhizopus arrhizus]